MNLVLSARGLEDATFIVLKVAYFFQDFITTVLIGKRIREFAPEKAHFR